MNIDKEIQDMMDVTDFVVACIVKLREESDLKSAEEWTALEEEKAMSLAHHSIGRAIRNSWGFWSDSAIAQKFNEFGVMHGDDMSAIVLDSFHRLMNGKDFEIGKSIAHYRKHWEEWGKDSNIIEENDKKRKYLVCEKCDTTYLIGDNKIICERCNK